MAIDFTDGRLWLELILLAITSTNSLILWLRQPGRDAQDAVKHLQALVDDRFVKIEGDYIRLEERIKHLPTERDFTELAKSIEAQTEATAAMRLELHRISDYLMNNK